MKRLYKVKLGDKTFDVEVEEITPPEKRKPFSTVYKSYDLSPISLVKKPAASINVQQEKTSPVGANTITSPMSGSIISIEVKVKDEVKEGDLLLKLEAMKMETSINSPRDGVVTEINCSVGKSVAAGGPLITLE